MGEVINQPEKSAETMQEHNICYLPYNGEILPIPKRRKLISTQRLFEIVKDTFKQLL